MTLDVLSEVLKAADYMEIEPLLDLVCLKYTFLMVGMDESQVRRMDGVEGAVESLLKGRSCNCSVLLTYVNHQPPFPRSPSLVRSCGGKSVQIRALLNLPEMSPDEEEYVREEHAWLFS